MADEQDNAQHEHVQRPKPKQAVAINIHGIDVIALLKIHGWPTLLLVVMCLGAWRACVWIAPKLDRAVEAHISTTEENNVLLKKCTESQLKQAENGEKLMKYTEKMSDVLERDDKRIDDIHSAVVRRNVP